jgi:UDPglucose 6-dehydrogenase
MFDINDEKFLTNFSIEKSTIGVIGYGYVGQAVGHFFSRNRKANVCIFDKAKPELGNFEDVVSKSELIFVCVPTPMQQDGSCHTGIVEEVLDNIYLEAINGGRDLDSFIVVIKSTVYPGFIERMKEEFVNLRVVFSPEFLTEKNSFQDIVNQNRIIVGGDEEDALIVLRYFQNVEKERFESGELNLFATTSTTAELVKLFANGILAAKIMFCNEIYLIAQALGVEYEEVRQLACLDERIGSSHTMVPGHDGWKGYGGHCFEKDLNNLKNVCKQLNVDEKVISAVVQRNHEVREKEGWDWLAMKGRAVIE